MLACSRGECRFKQVLECKITLGFGSGSTSWAQQTWKRLKFSLEALVSPYRVSLSLPLRFSESGAVMRAQMQFRELLP